MTMPSEKQLRVGHEGKRAEWQAVEWLEKHGFSEVTANPRPIGCWDIRAQKRRQKWVIEVKSGENPKIHLVNFERMLKLKGFTNIGLALVTKNYVHLLEYPKMRFAAFKAWDERRRNAAALPSIRQYSFKKSIKRKPFGAHQRSNRG